VNASRCRACSAIAVSNRLLRIAARERSVQLCQ
jgi:hypothetical protein